jgi:hypothetical protein
LRQEKFRILASQKASDESIFAAIPLWKPNKKDGTSPPLQGAEGGLYEYSTGVLHALLGDMSHQATSVMHKLTSTTMQLRQAESEILKMDRRRSFLNKELIDSAVKQSGEIRSQAAALDEQTVLAAKMKQDMVRQELSFKNQLRCMQKASMGELSGVRADLEATHASDLCKA